MNEGTSPDYRGTVHRRTAALREWHARAQPEEVLEPSLEIVDAHHHLYDRSHDARHHYRLNDLAEDFSGGHRIVATVYVEAYESGWHTDGPEHLKSTGEVEGIAQQTRAPLALPQGPCEVAAAIVSHVDLTLGDAAVAEALAAHAVAGEGRLRGVRHVTNFDAGTIGRFIAGHPRAQLLADPAFRQGFARLQEHGLSYDAWVYHPQLGELCALADAFPQTTIVVDHAGGLIGVAEYREGRTEQLALWRRELEALAQRPNVMLKLGGLGMPVFGFGFEHRERPANSAELAQAWQPMVDTCLEAFGPARCMLESNFPVDKQSCGYTALWNTMKRVTQSLAAQERALLFGGTARRVYRLPAQDDQAST